VASGSVEGGIQGAVAGKNAVENNHLSTIEKITLNSKEKEYAASCNGDNSNNSSCAGLKQEISKLHKKGQGIDKNEISELGPDFQLGGVDSIEHKPGDVVSCVNSGNGFCVVIDKTAPNGQEWMLEPANKIQAITAKKQNGKTEDFIKELGAAYFEAGCGMPGVASSLCQTYSAAGGVNPISGKVPTDEERVTWAIAAAANTVGNVAAPKASNTAQGTIRIESLGNIEEFLESQSKNLNKKLGAKIGEGRLPYETGKMAFN
jgi:filamentous hemagglutinin